VVWPVEVRYEVGMQPDFGKRGPPFGLRTAGAGASALGSGFLLLPFDPGTTTNEVSWDLSRMPSGSLGVISAGEGDVFVPGPPAKLDDQWFFFGPMGRYVAPGDIAFTGYWMGKPPFDPKVEIPIAAKGYAALAVSVRRWPH
jgi:hypothetical protein